MANFASLTLDIQERILLNLTQVGLLPFKLRLVCKTWNFLIVPIKFRRWEVKRLDENMDPAELRSKTWPNTWVYSKIRKYTRTITVRRKIDGHIAGFLNGLKSIRAIDIIPDDGCRGSLAWEDIAEPIFTNWLPAYLIRLTSISLRLVKIIEFLESVQPSDIPRLKWFRTDSYCGEDHGKIPYRCIRASRMLVTFIGSYKMLEKVNIRLTDAYVGANVDLAQALSFQKSRLRILSVRDTSPSIKPLSTMINFGPQSLKTLASSCHYLTHLTVDIPAQLFFLGTTSCALYSDGIDPSIVQWIYAVASFKTLRRLYIHTYSFQTFRVQRNGVVKFDNHNQTVEAAARELFTRLTFAKEGVLFDEMEIRYKVFRGKKAPPHSAPRKGITVVNCWLYKYVSTHYSWNGVRQGVNSAFTKETLSCDAWPEP